MGFGAQGALSVRSADVCRRRYSETQIHTQAGGQIKRQVHHQTNRSHKAPYHHGAGEQQGARIFALFLALLVVPLDGIEHARAEHKRLERDKGYWYPIHGEKFPSCNEARAFGRLRVSKCCGSSFNVFKHC